MGHALDDKGCRMGYKMDRPSALKTIRLNCLGKHKIGQHMEGNGPTPKQKKASELHANYPSNAQ